MPLLIYQIRQTLIGILLRKNLPGLLSWGQFPHPCGSPDLLGGGNRSYLMTDIFICERGGFSMLGPRGGALAFSAAPFLAARILFLRTSRLNTSRISKISKGDEWAHVSWDSSPNGKVDEKPGEPRVCPSIPFFWTAFRFGKSHGSRRDGRRLELLHALTNAGLFFLVNLRAHVWWKSVPDARLFKGLLTLLTFIAISSAKSHLVDGGEMLLPSSSSPSPSSSFCCFSVSAIGRENGSNSFATSVFFRRFYWKAASQM